MQRLRVVERAAEIADRPDLLTPDEFAARPGVAPEALQALRQSGQILCADD